MIKYYNDGKEKSQSHEIYIDLCFTQIYGYGESYEEAKVEFIKNLREAKADILETIATAFNDADANKYTKVDCMGKEVQA